MSVQTVTSLISDALFMIIKTAAPPLLVSLIVGLSVSIFQTVTSIQEQTLTFIPKFLGIFLVLMIAGGWMLENMSGLMTSMWNDFAVYIR
ncbi:MAG: flagellar biosynthesis protein FliQ [Lachnospiraceae bacterium]|nr:flagellar biosynthesis protein FliQ [Lachnospiraceae bacterium]